ncbi:MAG: sigma-70 family RNA polymerase sigma factor [Clostridiales bacterium]|jgi:RNA polymerase sporulation-specific sigma factor|nr:sigma-70 family RNA polymerase sigma factor [Clostridiales bacterium]
MRTDEELAAAARGGDADAFDALLTRYKSVVLTCVRPFFLSGGGRDDLVQEGMIGLYRAVLKYDSSRSAGFKGFAVTCIKRGIIDAVRKDNSGKNLALNGYVPIDGGVEFFLPSSNNPEDVLIGAEAVEEIKQRSKNLSRLESIILSKYLDGKTYSEISGEICATQKSVDNAIQRIRKKLQ